MEKNFKNLSILVTGGTGSFGKKFTEVILKKYQKIKKIVVFSRDEFKQYEMQKKFAKFDRNKKLRFFLGDARDSKRLDIALNDIDLVIPHQANSRIIEAVVDRIGIDPEKMYVNLNRYGNTSAASVIVALDEAIREEHAKVGDLILLTVFGAGLTWGSALIRL